MKTAIKAFKKIHIPSNKLDNVLIVKSNGKDGNGIDISVLFKEITHISPTEMVVSIVNKLEFIPYYSGSKWLNMRVLKIIMKTKMNGADTQ